MRAQERTRVSLTPLLSGNARCTLLEIDSLKILLDCGWDHHLNPQDLQPLAEVAPEIQAVLLSHPDIAHVGAIPYARAKLGLRCQVYATLPVHKMGLMFLYDLYQNLRLQSEFDTFNLDDVDNAFASFTEMRYSQRLSIGAGESGVFVTPRPAGYMLGGCVWEITKNAEFIVYAPDFNHRRERLLPSAALEGFHRPSLAITGAEMAHKDPPQQQKQREQNLTDSVLTCLRADGTVLVPTDTAGRVLEMLLTLTNIWSESKLHMYRIILFTNVASTTLEFANTHMEWMNEQIASRMHPSKGGIFSRSNVTICHSIAQFDDLPAGPKVVFATNEDLESGPARTLFTRVASSIANLVLFLREPPTDSLANQVLEQSRQPMPQRDPIQIELSQRVELEGKELEEHERRQQQMQRTEEEHPVMGQEREQEDEEALYVTDERASDTSYWHHDAELSALSASGEAAEKARNDQGESAAPVRKAPRLEAGRTSGKELDTPAEAEESSFSGRDQPLVDGFEPEWNDEGPVFPLRTVRSSGKQTNYGVAPDLGKLQRMWEAAGTIGSAQNGEADSENEHRPSFLQLPSPEPETVEVQPYVERPSKIVTEHVSVSVRCAVLVTPFEGKADSKSVRTLVSQMKPRRCAIIGSNDADRSAMVDAIRSQGVEALTTEQLRTEDVSSETAMYSVRIGDDLLQSAGFRRLGEYEVAFVEGELEAESEESMPMLRRSGAKAMHTAASSVFVGELKLSELRSALVSRGISAEFGKGGVLHCGRNTCVSKSGAEMTVEGCASDEFHNLRSCLYDLYQMV